MTDYFKKLHDIIVTNEALNARDVVDMSNKLAAFERGEIDQEEFTGELDLFLSGLSLRGIGLNRTVESLADQFDGGAEEFAQMVNGFLSSDAGLPEVKFEPESIDLGYADEGPAVDEQEGHPDDTTRVYL